MRSAGKFNASLVLGAAGESPQRLLRPLSIRKYAVIYHGDGDECPGSKLLWPQHRRMG